MELLAVFHNPRLHRRGRSHAIALGRRGGGGRVSHDGNTGVRVRPQPGAVGFGLRVPFQELSDGDAGFGGDGRAGVAGFDEVEGVTVSIFFFVNFFSHNQLSALKQ